MDLIVAELAAARKFLPDGTVQVMGLEPRSTAAFLVSAIESDLPFSHAERHRLIVSALWETLNDAEVNRGRLQEAIRRHIEARLRNPTTEYTLAARLSIRPPTKPIIRRLGTVRLRIGGPFPKWAALRRPQVAPADIESKYATFVARCHAGSPLDAYEMIASEVDALRGMWNLFLMFGTGSTNYGKRRPQNQVRFGSNYVLRWQGEKGSDILDLYEDDHAPPIFVTEVGERWKQLLITERWTRRRLRESTHREFLHGMLVQYARALDEKIPHKAILLLWALLERLTGTGRESYDTTIRRASFLFRDRARTRFELECIREFRNTTVHGLPGAETPHEYSEILLVALKSVVDAICKFHLFTADTYSELATTWRLMDAPREESELRRQLAVIQRALRMVERSSPDSDRDP